MRASAAATQERLGGPGQWVLEPAADVRRGGAGALPVAGGRARAAAARRARSRRRGVAAGARFVSLVPTQLHRLLDDPAERRRAARASTRCWSAAARSTRRCARRGRGGRRPGGRDVRHERDRRRLRVRRLRRWTASSSRSATDGRIRLGGPTLFDGYDGDPALTAEVAGRRVVPHLRRRPARRGRPAAGARPARRRGGQRRRERPGAGRRRPAARAPGRRAGRGGRRTGRGVGQPGGRVRRRRPSRSTRRATGSPRRIRARGRRAGRRGRALPLLANGKVGPGARCGELGVRGLLDPAADPVPRHHRARGRAAPRRRPGWGEWSPFLEYDARRGRAVAALRRGGGRRRLAGAGARLGARST